MTLEEDALHDWHRLFGLLLMDFFSGSPFKVEVERDLSVQQQRLDVLIVRRGRGRFAGRLPDGLEGLRPYNLLSFKSHHEALDGWAIKELVGADQRLARTGGLRPERLPPALGADQPAARATVREASRGGLCRVVHHGGLQPPVHQGALPATDAGRAGRGACPAVS